MLKVTGIRKAFKDNEVLKGVDLEVKKGDVVNGVKELYVNITEKSLLLDPILFWLYPLKA